MNVTTEEGRNVPLMKSPEKSDVVTLAGHLDDLSGPVAETLLLRKHQLVNRILKRT